MGGIRREREGYIPKSGPANRNQKIQAKEAFIRLLGKGRHTPREIAEHFGMSAEVVNELIDELIKSGQVERMPGSRTLVGLRDTGGKLCQRE